MFRLWVEKDHRFLILPTFSLNIIAVTASVKGVEEAEEARLKLW